MLSAWCWFAAALLILGFGVHVLTFLRIDLLARWPENGGLYGHGFVTPILAMAAYVFVEGSQGRLKNMAPQWLRVLTSVLIVYALINFVLWVAIDKGGPVIERDGRHLIVSHGTVLSELSEAEYKEQHARLVRFVTGGWMSCFCVALVLLVSAARLRRDLAKRFG